MNRPTPHQVAWVATKIRRVARELGVDLPGDYARRVAADTLARSKEAGITRLGRGVVLHTLPDDEHTLPIVVGYADPTGQWYRDGRRHGASAGPDVEQGAMPPPVVSR